MVWWVPAAIAVVGGVLEHAQGKKAGARADAAAAANAANIELETEEELRRMDRTQQFTMGSARAQLYNSGVTGQGLTATTVQSSLEDEYAAQRDFTKRAGESRADAARKGGQGVGDSAKFSGGASVAAGLFSGNKDESGFWWQ